MKIRRTNATVACLLVAAIAVASGGSAAAEEAAQKVAEQPKDLNALALLWAMIAGFFRRLFGRKETT